jgi:hypothetical protein
MTNYMESRWNIAMVKLHGIIYIYHFKPVVTGFRAISMGNPWGSHNAKPPGHAPLGLRDEVQSPDPTTRLLSAENL